MSDFNHIFKPTARPRWGSQSIHAAIRTQFRIETLALLGAILQVMLTLILPLRVAALPAMLILTLKIADAYLIKFGLRRNPHMDPTSITTKYSSQFPDAQGSFGYEPARSSMAVFLIGARNNSPLGAADPNFAKLGAFFQAMQEELKADPAANGFLGSSSWSGLERASNPTFMNVMYFRSAADVTAFAHGATHRKAWDWWYKNLAGLEDFSIFHELYQVPAGNHESVYVQMPPMLQAATQHQVTVEVDGEKRRMWQNPVVDARKGVLKSGKGRMRLSTGADNDKYNHRDLYEDEVIVQREQSVSNGLTRYMIDETKSPTVAALTWDLPRDVAIASFYSKQPTPTHEIFSQDINPHSRQSPDPERQSGAQVNAPADPNRQGGAPSLEHGKEKSDEHKQTGLPSNPKGPLEDEAKAKTSKQ